MRVSRDSRYAAVVLVGIATLLAGCTAVVPEAALGTMGISFNIPPIDPVVSTVQSVILRIEPAQGGESAEYELDVVDSTASGEIDVAPGSWNLEAEVYGDGEILLASGSGYAVVLPGAITEVNLHLHSVTGGLDIGLDWDDGPPLYVADISYRPVRVEIERLDTFYVHGLSRIGWDIQVIEFPTHDGRTIKEPGVLSYPDLALVGLEGSAGSVEALATWTPEDPPQAMYLILEGLAGEELHLYFYDVVLVDSNTEITLTGPYLDQARMGGVRLRYSHFDLESYVPTYRETDPESIAVFPGQGIEFALNEMRPSYAYGVLDAPLPGENPAFWLPSIYAAEVAYVWGESTLEVLDAYNAVDRQSMSIINYDELGEEIDRDNIHMVWPAGINLFNPEKPYGETFLVDLFIVGEWVEDG